MSRILPVMDEYEIAMAEAMILERISNGEIGWAELLEQPDNLRARKHELARWRARAEKRELADVLMEVELGVMLKLGRILAKVNDGNEDPALRGLKSVVVVDGDGEICGICLEELKQGDETKAMDCMHRFHPSCIAQWLKSEKNTCPLCRYQFNATKNLRKV